MATYFQNLLKKSIWLFGLLSIFHLPNAKAQLVITEIMYNHSTGPGSEPGFEWVEVYNSGDITIDLTDYLFDDSVLGMSSANITSGTIPARSIAVLFNEESITSSAFTTEWQSGLNLIGVTDWPPGLNNTGDQIGIWESISSHAGGFVDAIDDVAYESGTNGWPASTDGTSIILVMASGDPSTENDLGSNWTLAQDGVDGGFSGTSGDIGSPGSWDTGVLDCKPTTSEVEGDQEVCNGDVLSYSVNTEKSIVISEVLYNDLTQDKVEILNIGTETVDISSWQLCSKFSYGALTNTSGLVTGIASGSTNLAPGEMLVLEVTLDNLAADLGLYNSTSFSSAAAMQDFVQWGSPNNGRESVAVEKGIWLDDDFVPVGSTGESLEYDGYGFSAINWINQPSPTLGSQNQFFTTFDWTVPVGTVIDQNDGNRIEVTIGENSGLVEVTETNGLNCTSTALLQLNNAYVTWYEDSDGDGFGDSESTQSDCVQPEGFVSNDEDCDDSDAAINPETIWFADLDEDGLGDAETTLEQCEQPTNYVLNDDDPDDSFADSDLDGLSNSDEINIYTTDPNDPDTDNDGLEDGEEVNVYSTDPTVEDSDSDGLDDGEEIELGTDPNDADTDGDGLEDGQEDLLGTDPNDPDSDDDGLDDGDEIDAGTDPLDEDTDNDDLNDGDEIALGSDPDNPDTDGDGLEDGDEVFTYGSDPTDSDTDGDGLEDGDEVLLYGTDPDDDDSDGDSLSDYDEIFLYGTEPTDRDTDGDGLDDDEEIFIYGSEPDDSDSDGDTLSDGDEVNIYGTDPTSADTDLDGCDDDVELVFGTDPVIEDSDQDNDGLKICEGDCDDNDPNIQIPTWYADNDGDGYGDPLTSINDCLQPAGYIVDNTDCNDADPSINPETIWYADEDGDGYGNPDNFDIGCEQPVDHVLNNLDCNSGDPNINPDGEDAVGIDGNCDGTLLWYTDLDGDGFAGTETISSTNLEPDAGSNEFAEALDCDDENADLNPETIWYADEDGDGYGNPDNFDIGCEQPEGHVSNNLDCNSGNPDINPDGEDAIGIDGNCDSTLLWYTDLDGDGFAGSSTLISTNTTPDESLGEYAEITDCNDFNPDFNPETIWYADEDGDGYGNPDNFDLGCTQPENHVSNNLDCNPGDATVNPDGTDLAGSGVDANCDGFYLWFSDLDGDGFAGESTISSENAVPGTGEFELVTDCDDTNQDLNPNTKWYADTDGDGFGNTDNFDFSCEQPEGHILVGGDCDDGNATVYPGAEALPDGLDNDCDGTVDKVTQTITLEPIADQSDDGSAIEVVSSASSNLVVELNVEGPANIDGTTLTLTGAGSITITASQAGDEGYEAAEPVSISFCANPLPVITAEGVGTASLMLSSNYETGNSWLLNGTAISDATESLLEVTEEGSYRLLVDIDGCVGESADFDAILTGIQSEMQGSISIYPNPASHSLNYEITVRGIEPVEIMIINLDGKILKREQRSVQNGKVQGNMDLGQLPGGLYLLAMQTKTAGVVVQRFEKK